MINNIEDNTVKTNNVYEHEIKLLNEQLQEIKNRCIILEKFNEQITANNDFLIEQAKNKTQLSYANVVNNNYSNLRTTKDSVPTIVITGKDNSSIKEQLHNIQDSSK